MKTLKLAHLPLDGVDFELESSTGDAKTCNGRANGSRVPRHLDFDLPFREVLFDAAVYRALDPWDVTRD